MANASALYQLEVASQYQGEGAQRFVRALSSRLYAERLGDGFTFAKSNAYTNTGSVIKSSAGRLYGLIIEPATTAATGTGGTGFVQLFNAESLSGPWAAGGVTFMKDVVGFVTAMTRTVLYDPGVVDNTSLYGSGISLAVCTTASGSTAVASLPTVTVCYA